MAIYQLLALIIFADVIVTNGFLQNRRISISHPNMQIRDFQSLLRLHMKEQLSFGDIIRKKALLSFANIAISSVYFLNPEYSFADSGNLFKEVWNIINDNYYDDTFNGQGQSSWMRQRDTYLNTINKGGDEKASIIELIGKLGDKYSRILDKEKFESIWKYDAIGIGALLQSEPGKFMTVASQPIKGSSSYNIGLTLGDIVYNINGESTDQMAALTLLDKMSNDDRDYIDIEYGVSSSPQNKMKATLKRSIEKSTDPVTFKELLVPSSLDRSVDSKTKVGYIKLSEFNSKAVEKTANAIKSLSSNQVEYLILDLLGNTGGGFQFALNIGGMFMDDKVMAIAKGKLNEQNVFKSSYSQGVLWNKPLIILTDELSASASEVLAGGLHDNCRAVIVGQNSFGKGKIQAVFGLSDGEGLTLTVAQYVTPKGTIIQSKGLTPDVQIPLNNAYFNYVLNSVGLVTQPKFDGIDFSRIQELLKICKPAN